MKNLRMFEVRYIGPTDTEGSRVKIIDTRHGKSITASLGMAQDDFIVEAQKLLESKGISVCHRAWHEKNHTDFLFSEDFVTQLKEGAK